VKPPASHPPLSGASRPILAWLFSQPIDSTVNEPTSIKYQASSEDEGQRLDLVLAKRLGISRTRAAALAKSGAVVCESAVKLKASTPVKAGDIFTLPQIERSPRGSEITPEKIPLAILFEDEHLLVVDKPAGMVVHPAPGHSGGTLVNALLAHINTSVDSRLDVLRPGIVHRLDKDTSGLLVVAKTFEAHEKLSSQIKERSAGRVYLAVSCGHWPQPQGRIEAPVGRSPKNRKKMAVLTADGRPAVTAYRVLESFPLAELVEVVLHTGRTHQIRVHFAHRGHPVLGDPLYGGRKAVRNYSGQYHNMVRMLLEACDRQALHAYRLSFKHPASGQAVEFTSPLPEDFERVLQILRQPSD
jgi:23S rRNA pseudouridine1911/1915/1917 synthase